MMAVHVHGYLLLLANGCLRCHLPLSALDYLGASDAIPSLAIGEQSVLAIMHLLLLLIHVLRNILLLRLPGLHVLPSTPVIH
jgi:hypothetical protein